MLKRIKNLLNSNALWLAIIVTISIVYLSLVKIGAQPISFKFLDKIEHCIAYAVLSFLWLISYRNKKHIQVIIIGCISLGILLEFVQSQTGYRTFEVNDMLANTLGVFIGMIFSKIYLKK